MMQLRLRCSFCCSVSFKPAASQARLAGLAEFILLFAGGGVFGYVAGRLLLWCMRQVSGDRLAEATFTLAFAYLSFIAAERLFHVSGVVTVLGRRLDLERAGTFTPRAGKLVLSVGTVGADRVLGAFIDLCSGFNARSASAVRRRSA